MVWRGDYRLLLGEVSDWRLVFGSLGAVLIATLPAHYRAWGVPLSHAPRQHNQPDHLTGTMVKERIRDACPLFLGMILWSMSVYGSYTMFGTAFQGALEWPLPMIAAMLMCFGIGATVGSLSGGRLADRMSATSVIRWSFALSAVAFLFSAWAYTIRSPWVMGPALMITATLTYSTFPALQTRAAEQFHAIRPVVLGLMSSALYVGITAGAFVGASMYQHAGMVYVLIVSACLAMIGHLLGRWLHSRQKQSPRQIVAA